MIKDEAPEPASQTEEMPSQKGAVLEEPPADSTDHLEEKELGRTQARERGISWLNTAVSVEELYSKKERKKLIETKILSKIILKPSPKQDVEPPSHGINNGLGGLAKEKTSSAEHLGEVTPLSLQASGPKIKLWGLLPVGWGHNAVPAQSYCSEELKCPILTHHRGCVLHKYLKLSQSCQCKSKAWQKPWISSKAHGTVQGSQPQHLFLGGHGVF